MSSAVPGTSVTMTTRQVSGVRRHVTLPCFLPLKSKKRQGLIKGLFKGLALWKGGREAADRYGNIKVTGRQRDIDSCKEPLIIQVRLSFLPTPDTCLTMKVLFVCVYE